jgi:hypothetical protein
MSKRVTWHPDCAERVDRFTVEWWCAHGRDAIDTLSESALVRYARLLRTHGRIAEVTFILDALDERLK